MNYLRFTGTASFENKFEYIGETVRYWEEYGAV
jgi:hypothetical protein